MRAGLAHYNTTRPHKLVDDIRIGIGLNIGPCSVGNMGSLQRFDYSALGDPMNVAARLEALTKDYGVDVLATDVVAQRTPGFAWLEIDAVRVKGRSATTRLFTLFGDEAFAQSLEFTAHAARHEAMLLARRLERFKDAEQIARELSRELPWWSPLYAKLAERYAAASPTTAIASELPETNLAPTSAAG